MSAALRAGAAPTRYSLRRRLVLLITAVVGALWLLAAVAAFQLAHHEADELFDNQLRQTADTLLGIVAGGEVNHFIEELDEHGDHYELPISYEVWRVHKGREQLLAASSAAAAMLPPNTVGFFERREDGKLWRYFAAVDPRGRYRVVTGQEHADRYHVGGELALRMLVPAALGLPLMAFGIWWVVGRALRPVDGVARQVAALDPQNLQQVDVPEPLPDEIEPLVGALNTLIGRVSLALENERRFTADAAHELRTPLAALRVQAQVARKTADDAARRRALEQVIAAVDRMTHLVEQLLTLARLDPAAGASVPLERVEPEALAAAVVAEHVPEADRHGQSIELETEPGCAIETRPGWVEIALRNLLSNALRYGGPGARVVVRVGAAAGKVWIAVEDDGPGIDAALRPQMLGRFARGESAVGIEGCGLGLSIVGRIAELSGASLVLDDGLQRADGGHGLAARLVFPAA